MTSIKVVIIKPQHSNIQTLYGTAPARLELPREHGRVQGVLLETPSVLK